MLNGQGATGTGGGIINSLSFPSNVQPSYAPAGKSLASISIVGDPKDVDEAELERRCRSQLEVWFGKDALKTWRHIKTYRIPYSLPNQAPPHPRGSERDPPVPGESKVFCAGDWCNTPTLNGAIESGRRAAEAALAAIQ